MAEKVAHHLADVGKDNAFEFYRDGTSAMGRIRLRDGGKVPECLAGGWTNQRDAKSAVDAYLAGKVEKPPANTIGDAEQKKSSSRRRTAAK